MFCDFLNASGTRAPCCCSNGGTGVTRGIENFGNKFKGYILFSAVIESEFLSMPSFVEKSESKPFLIMHGGQDLRILESSIAEACATIRSNGNPLDYYLIEDEDHFMFFSKRSEIVKSLSLWFDRYVL